VAGVLVIWLARPSALSIVLGAPFLLAGEALRVWASGHIEKGRSLATGGPYAHTRNPLYLGSVLLAVGVAAASASPWTALLIAAYLLVFYPAVIREEEGFLRGKFPEPFASWARSVPAFLPRATPAGPRETRFAWSRVGANREWRTVMVLPVLVGLLAARGLLPR
jgi:protein-S-isoprenylcysteine O-methyltransferase Ste14